jgi:hypothetical protein
MSLERVTLIAATAERSEAKVSGCAAQHLDVLGQAPITVTVLDH